MTDTMTEERPATELATTTTQAIADASPDAAAAMIVHTEHALLPAPIRKLKEMAWLISTSMNAPVAFQGKPERCLSIAYQAALWRMDGVAVASKCYLTPVKGGGERLSYEAQLVHAVILSRVRFAPGGAPRTEFFGEKGQRYAVVTATLAGESKPRQKASPIIGQITPKNSPLWTTDPDQQLHYWTTRSWARMHAPDALLGVYSADEMPVIQMDGSGTPADPYAMEEDDADPPPPSGGAGTINRDPKPSQTKAGGTRQEDIGENPWPDVEDIMEWLAGFRSEIETAGETGKSTDVIRLWSQAKSHGLISRLKTASKNDAADLASFVEQIANEMQAKEAQE